MTGKDSNLEELQLKVNMILKAFFSFYAGDKRYDFAFDSMKNAVIGDLLKILDTHGDPVLRNALEDMFVKIPYDGRGWWETGVRMMLEHHDPATKARAWDAILASTGMGNERSSKLLPPSFLEVFRNLLNSVDDMDRVNCLKVYLLKPSFQQTDEVSSPVDEGPEKSLEVTPEYITELLTHKNEKVRTAAFSAGLQWLGNHPPPERDRWDDEEADADMLKTRETLSKGMAGLLDDTNKTVQKTVVEHFQEVVRQSGLSLEPLMHHSNNEIRYEALRTYLGVEKDGRLRVRSYDEKEPDLTVVATFVSDPYGPIARLAKSYLGSIRQSRW